MSLYDKEDSVHGEAMSVRGKGTSEYDEGMSVCPEVTSAA